MADNNLPLETRIRLDALRHEQQNTRAQLDILRKTRGQREVGSVKIPPHLRSEERVVIAGAARDPRACRSCGRGLSSEELSPQWRGAHGQFCRACYNNPNSDAGTETRADISRNVLP